MKGRSHIEYAQGVSLGVEHILVQGDAVVGREQQVQVPAASHKHHTGLVMGRESGAVTDERVRRLHPQYGHQHRKDKQHALEGLSQEVRLLLVLHPAGGLGHVHKRAVAVLGLAVSVLQKAW